MWAKVKFYVILASTIVLGVLFSAPGAFIHDHGWIVTVLIMLMYLGIGVSIDTRDVIKGLTKWREILFSQAVLFIISPLIAYALYSLFIGFSCKEAMIGLMFVSALATTISSGIMLTESMNGNSVLSMYIVIFSQLLGVFAAPLVISIVLKQQFSMATSVLSVIKSLALNMILPFIAGQFLGRFRERLKKPAKLVSNYSIFIILYSYIGYAQANGYLGRIFTDLVVPALSVICFALALIFFVIFSTKMLGFAVPDRICLVFSCTLKTMGMGIPMAVLFFPSNADVALYVSMIIIIYYVVSMVLSLLISRFFFGKESLKK